MNDDKKNREFYTQQQNEQFFNEAAIKFLQQNTDVKKCDIYDQNGINKYKFFKLYFQKYHWSKGVWENKNLAKRMYDGIQRYFIAYFEQLIKIFVHKHIEAPDIMQRVINEAQDCFSQVKLDQLILRWMDMTTKLVSQKNFCTLPMDKMKPFKQLNLSNLNLVETTPKKTFSNCEFHSIQQSECLLQIPILNQINQDTKDTAENEDDDQNGQGDLINKLVELSKFLQTQSIE